MNIVYNIKTVTYASLDYKKVVALRDKILRKPLGLQFSEQDLAVDKNEIIIGLFTQNKCLGCVQMRHVDQNEIKLRQMAVDNSMQGKGLGREILKFAEEIALSKKYNKICLHARKTAVKFYEKFGFSVIGNEFFEVKIPHYTMCKKLS